MSDTVTGGAPPVLAGLYAMADTSVLGEDVLIQAVGQALEGGARVVQYRSKDPDPGLREWQAVDLLHLCRGVGVPLIVNDDVELAARIGAAGVHLGREDDAVATARERLGANAIVGASCYGSLEVAQQAVLDGASYVAFGRFFPSSTKPFAAHTDAAILRRAKQVLAVPVVAIGGITAANGGELVAAGADMLAVAAGLFRQADVKAAATQLARLFD